MSAHSKRPWAFKTDRQWAAMYRRLAVHNAGCVYCRNTLDVSDVIAYEKLGARIPRSLRKFLKHVPA